MKTFYGSFLILVLISQYESAHAQAFLTGKVLSRQGVILPNSSVSQLDRKSEKVINFDICDDQANYKLKINLSEDSLRVKVTRMGYASRIFILPITTAVYDFVLEEQSLRLKEVLVKGPPINIKKDTLDYNVSAFVSKQDRTVSDVIRKLPGIEVLKGGQILYQGLPIQKYYVNGLDMLEGRYGLANDNLPVDAVKKIQIIENDQPIKILKGKIFSEKASINVQLKKFTTTGYAKVGVGLTPILWDANVTPMTFNKNFQVINSVQSNNVGADVTSQLKDLISNKLFDISGNFSPQLLGLQPLSPPPFGSERWLNNRTHIASSNLLRKFKEDLQVKLSLSMSDNWQRQSGSTFTRLLTQTGEIDISEQKQNTFRTRRIQGSVGLEKNTDRIYLKNNVSGDFGTENGLGNLSNSARNIIQNARFRNFSLRDNFSLLSHIGKQLVDIKSEIDYNNSPQLLIVNPGQFEAIFNNARPFATVAQKVGLSNFQSQSSIGLTKQIKKFTFVPTFGFFLQKHTLTSNIDITENEGSRQLPCPFLNDFRFGRKVFFAKMNSYLNAGRWKIEVSLPIRYQVFELDDRSGTLKTDLKRLTFEPGISKTLLLTDYISLVSHASFSNNFGSPSQLYSSYIVTSYRNLQRRNAILPESKMLNYSINLNYKNPSNFVFANAVYAISGIRNNLIARSEIDSTGANTIFFDLGKNLQNNQRLDLRIGKYFAAARASVKLNTGVGKGKSEQFVNGLRSEISNINYQVGLYSSITISQYLNITLAESMNFLVTKISNNLGNKTRYGQHEIDFTVFPSKSQIFDFKMEYYTNNAESQKNQLYIDCYYRYTIPNSTIDLQIKCNNLLNTERFVSFSNNSIASLQNSFDLRARQFLLSASFSFADFVKK